MAYDATPVIDYLNERDILFEVHRHAQAATAQETAQAQHVSGKLFAKTVAVRHGRKIVLAVLPAHERLDLRKLELLSGLSPLRLAAEPEFAHVFANCEVGAMPPFGHLYSQFEVVDGTTRTARVEVFVDADIATAPSVTFNACSHRHTITVSGKDFLRAIECVVGDIAG